MSFFQIKSSYRRLRAEETRVLAETMTTNLQAYGVMLRIADEYERLASGKLGSRTHRYWHMRFCSSARMSAYRQRLSPDTQQKILQLDIHPSWKTAS